MAIRIDDSIELTLQNVDNLSNRAEIRQYLLSQWIDETPGLKYRYFAETLSNGNRLYLERPGRLNKGCDFVIYLEGALLHKNGNDKPPKHSYIIEDLKLKKQKLKIYEFDKVQNGIGCIYDCKPTLNALNKTKLLPSVGISYEGLFYMIKWFFIEQDITYWAKSGRHMLFNTIKNV